MNISFFSLVAGWMPVINLRKSASGVLIPVIWFVTFCCTILQRNLFLCLCMGGLNLLIKCQGYVFSAQKKGLLNHNS